MFASGVEAHVRPSVLRREPASGEDRLPPALVEVHPRADVVACGRRERSGIPHTVRVAIHEVDIRRLVDELVHVRSLVDEDDDSQHLVLQDRSLQSPERPSVRYPAPVVSLDLVVCHVYCECSFRTRSESMDANH